MQNRLVTSDGTRILTAKEYDIFVDHIPNSMKSIFEISVITGLKYVELQKLYDNPQWYNKKANQIILLKETKNKDDQKPLKIISKLPPIFPNIFSRFINNRKPPYRSSWNKDLARWSLYANISPKVGLKTPRKTIESWMLKARFNNFEIYDRLGCDSYSFYKKYQNIYFTEDEISDIDEKLIKWRILKREYQWGIFYG